MHVQGLGSETSFGFFPHSPMGFYCIIDAHVGLTGQQPRVWDNKGHEFWLKNSPSKYKFKYFFFIFQPAGRFNFRGRGSESSGPRVSHVGHGFRVFHGR